MNSLCSRFCSRGLIALAVSLLISGCYTQRDEIVSTPQGSQLYDVLLAKRSSSQRKIGRVAVDKEYRLKIISVIPNQKDFLTETFDVINAKNELHAEAAPPQGAPQFSDFSRVVNRTSPAFFPQLQTHLKQYYDLVLQPAGK